MNKRQKTIRNAVDFLYKIIKDSNDKLERLRQECKHEITKKGAYQWGGPGHYFPNANICAICDKLIDSGLNN